MNKLNIYKHNDAWILHREEITTIKDGVCNVYVLLEAHDNYCFGNTTSSDLPTKTSITNLLKKAKKKSGGWPKQILISKKDPFVTMLEEIGVTLNLVVESATSQDLQPYIQIFSEGFTKFKYGATDTETDDLTDIEEAELKAFVPDTYDPCWCGSDKKFKFCCQKGFNDIVFAMCAAETGNHKKALVHMQDVESKLGRTAEVLCRYSICWSFVDPIKSDVYLDEAIKLNPNHPRSNYLLGINAVSKGDYKAAIEYYNIALAYYPKQDKFHLNETMNNLGSANFALQNYVEAKALWEKALMLLPTDEMTANNLYTFIYTNEAVPPEIREISPFIIRYLDKYAERIRK